MTKEKTATSHIYEKPEQEHVCFCLKKKDRKDQFIVAAPIETTDKSPKKKKKNPKRDESCNKLEFFFKQRSDSEVVGGVSGVQ